MAFGLGPAARSYDEANYEYGNAVYKTTLMKPNDNDQLDKQSRRGQVSVQLWDTAGMERFRAVTSLYLKNAEVILIAFALDNSVSFKNLYRWLDEVNE